MHTRTRVGRPARETSIPRVACIARCPFHRLVCIWSSLPGVLVDISSIFLPCSNRSRLIPIHSIQVTPPPFLPCPAPFLSSRPTLSSAISSLLYHFVPCHLASARTTHLIPLHSYSCPLYFIPLHPYRFIQFISHPLHLTPPQPTSRSSITSCIISSFPVPLHSIPFQLTEPYSPPHIASPLLTSLHSIPPCIQPHLSLTQSHST